MSKIFGKYIDDFTDVFFLEINNKNDIYLGYNIKENREVSLRIINKEKYKNDNLLNEALNKELKMANICKSENILKVFRLIETDKNFILEQEGYDFNMHEYIMNNGPSCYNKGFFKKIALELANALKILYGKKIMHRKIKSSTVFLKEKNDKYSVKLGDFSQAIFFQENISEPLDSFYYTAPEIINGEKYNEKCDLWSFGIILYDLYFGELPYGYRPSKIKIIKAISSQDNFIYKKSNIPSLDFLFENLFKINPGERLAHDQFFEIIFHKNFMNKNEKVILTKEINSLSESNHLLLNKDDNTKMELEKENINKEKYNNILYYDENELNMKALYRDYELFEIETPGAFILCTDIESLELIKKEILIEKRKNNNVKFNLLTTGSAFDKIINYIQKDSEFANCFENLCIYCIHLKKYENFKTKYQNKLQDNIFNKREDIINFIQRTSNDKIRPFKINQLINFQKYNKKYKNNYLQILKYYSDLDNEKYKYYLKKMELFINNKNKNELKIDKYKLLNGFKIDFNNIYITLNVFINIIYEDLNNFLKEDHIEECVAYFTSRIFKCFSIYSNLNNKYYNWDKSEIYMGTIMNFSEVLQYKRKGKIFFPNFNIFYEKKELAEKLSFRNLQNLEDNLKFSVIFILRNKEKDDKSGINIEDFYPNKEKAIIFLPFTLLELKDIKISESNHTADIYLETLQNK